MLAHPFAFLQGSAALMACDLAATPISGIRVLACGDCHLAKLGLFAMPERKLAFDLNDFDEALPAPWEWDIKRLAASIVAAGRVQGLYDHSNETAVHVFAQSYRPHLCEYVDTHLLDVLYSFLDDKTLIATAPNLKIRQDRQHVVAKARASVCEYLFPRVTGLVDGTRILDQLPFVFHFPEPRYSETGVPKLLSEYCKKLPEHKVRLFERNHFEDFAFKVVGVGSLGTCCFIVFLLAGSNNPLVLQVKEARPSVLEPYAGKSEFNHNGQRIDIGQRLMQSANGMFLGWLTSIVGIQFSVR